MALTTVTIIKDVSHFETELKQTPPEALLVVYFNASWASPCAQMSVVLDTLAQTFPVKDPPTIRFFSIDAEEVPDIAEQYDVTSVPYVVLQRDGKQLQQISGNKTAEVRDAVDKHAAGATGGAAGTNLPPAQVVSRPAQQPAPAAPVSNGASTTASVSGGAPATTPAKNLSAYAPDPVEPQPEPMSEEELHERLSGLVKAAPAMLFMKGTPSAPQCGFSRQLVSILREHSVRYGFFNILADEEVRQGMKKFADWPTFPQLWLGGELVGGLDIVKEEIENDPNFLGEYAVDQDKKAGTTAPAAGAAAVAA